MKILTEKEFQIFKEAIINKIKTTERILKSNLVAIKMIPEVEKELNEYKEMAKKWRIKI